MASAITASAAVQIGLAAATGKTSIASTARNGICAPLLAIGVRVRAGGDGEIGLGTIVVVDGGVLAREAQVVALKAFFGDILAFWAQPV